MSGDGRSLYVASYLDSAVVHFIRGTDGALSAVGCLGDAVDPGAHECGEAKEAPGLAGARALTLDPEGGSLYVAGHQDNAVALIQREVPPRCGPTWSTGGADTAQAIALNCIDPNGDPTAITIVSGPAHGSVTGPEPGGRDVVYIPHAGYSGVDGFSYGAQADGKDSELGWATVFVLLPEPPQPASVQPEEHVLPSLLALLALDRYTVRRGRRLTIRFAASAPGAVAFTISRSKRPLVTIRRTLKRAGVGAVKWSGKVAGRRRGLGPGRYALALSITSADGRVATDSAKLTVKR